MTTAVSSLNLANHGDQLGYDRSNVTIGIVHIGPGAFHRGHQAVYTHKALTLDPSWGICGVQMRSHGVRDALAGQDNLYTLAMLDKHTEYPVIGSIVELLSAGSHLEHVLARMAAATTHIYSTTVTEKAYCLTPTGDLDQGHEDIVHDLENPRQPRSVIGLISEALRLRKLAGYADVTVISCDNMSQNGQRLATAVCQYAGLLDEELAEWIASNIAFPSTMVDSITPATTDALRERVANEAGWRDAWPISREAFTQWVIEDKFSGPRPPWSSVGVEFTHRVDAYEKAKLRLLNGTHSSLAYIGLLAGYTTVGEAMKDKVLNYYLVDMMLQEIIPTLEAVSGLDYQSYSQDILARYRNPEIIYQLAQIAGDGSQKVPFRLLHTIEDALANNRLNQRQTLAVAAWMQFVRRCGQGVWDMTDGLKTSLLAIADQTTGEAERDVDLFLNLDAIFSKALSQSAEFRHALISAYSQLEGESAEEVLAIVKHC